MTSNLHDLGNTLEYELDKLLNLATQISPPRQQRKKNVSKFLLRHIKLGQKRKRRTNNDLRILYIIM